PPPMTAQVGSTMVTLPSLLSPSWSRGGTHLPGRRMATGSPVLEASRSRRPTGECRLASGKPTDAPFERQLLASAGSRVRSVPEGHLDPNDPPPSCGGSPSTSPYSISLPILGAGLGGAAPYCDDRSSTAPRSMLASPSSRAVARACRRRSWARSAS